MFGKYWYNKLWTNSILQRQSYSYFFCSWLRLPKRITIVLIIVNYLWLDSHYTTYLVKLPKSTSFSFEILFLCEMMKMIKLNWIEFKMCIYNAAIDLRYFASFSTFDSGAFLVVDLKLNWKIRWFPPSNNFYVCYYFAYIYVFFTLEPALLIRSLENSWI